MPNLPTGTVTFLFTDIEGSTTLLQRLGDHRYAEVLEKHQRLLRTAFDEGNGQEIDTQGDAILVAFPKARDAVAAAVAAQRAVTTYAWSQDAAPRVRMGLHTGEPLSGTVGYVGLDVHRAARICGAGHGGQILISDTTHALVAKDLPEGVSLRDLGEQRLKDLVDPQRLFQVAAADLLTDFPPLRSMSILHHNLPTQLTSFIGRDREIAEVKTMLASARLVTLTGAGGSGKTRLALQLGPDLLEQYADGVWFVELAALADPTLVPQTAASALGVSEQPRRALTATLIDFLRPKLLLLLLDNCEHILEACARLADVLLRACPNLRILATSREGLGIAGETLYPVPTLPVPDLERLPPMEALVQYESVRLFTERAAAVVPTFRVTPQNAKSVVQVCHDLDGIPLAIELAATRVKVLTVGQIVARLNDRFRLLTGSRHTALPRHQTLQAAMDWSHDLLAEKERILLRRLSIFAGGWTLEAAEAICSGDEIEASDILDLLTQLVSKSLVVVETLDAGARYRLLETMRQYGRRELVDSGEEAEVRKRHRKWFLTLAERAEPNLRGGFVGESSLVVWLDHLESEHDNLRAALEWSEVEGEEGEGLRLAAALGVFWQVRGYLSEGRGWLRGALKTQEGVSPALRAKALGMAGRLASGQADYSVARRYYEESLTIYRDLDDKENIGRLLRYMGGIMVRQGDLSARPRLEESLTIFRELGQMRQAAGSLVVLGDLARLEGDYAAARHLCEEGLALFRKLGDTEGIASALHHLGQASQNLGDLATARDLFGESLRIYRELGEQLGIGWALVGMGSVTSLMGDSEAGRSLLEESYAIFDKLGEKEGMGWALCGMGDVALSQGDHAKAKALHAKGLILFREVDLRPGILAGLARLAEVAWAYRHPTRAARLIGAEEVLREGLGGRHRVGRPGYLRVVAEVRGALGEEAFAAAWAKGRAMTLEQAIEYALGEEGQTHHADH